MVHLVAILGVRMSCFPRFWTGVGILIHGASFMLFLIQSTHRSIDHLLLVLKIARAVHEHPITGDLADENITSNVKPLLFWLRLLFHPLGRHDDWKIHWEV